jgi:signal transduction histidine kinase
MKPLDLQMRLTVWSAALVFFSLVLCGAGNALYLHRRAVAQLDRRIKGVADHFFFLRRLHAQTDSGRPDAHEFQEWLPHHDADEMVELRVGGETVFRSAGLGAAKLPEAGDAGSRKVRLSGGTMRRAVFSEGDATLTVFASCAPVEELGRDLLVIFSFGAPVSLGLAALGGRWIARKALEPVREIALSAERISSRDLARRVPVPEAEDDLRRMALVLNETFDRLAASFEQARRFSADASHELRTPLTALQVELEALLGSPSLAEADRAAVAGALETTQRLASIIRTLLALARADAGRLELERGRLDFAELVADCVEDAGIAAEAGGISVAFESPDRAEADGDPGALRQIASNLLDNAVKFNRPGGDVGVRLAAEGDDWVLDVANTGAGIPPESLPDLFRRFSRAGQHGDVPGHGLGLSLARELARAHGGDVELLRSGEGLTVFRFRLPRS